MLAKVGFVYGASGTALKGLFEAIARVHYVVL
jgi:hypothetical protein